MTFERFEHDEIYLIDLWAVLVREWRWFVCVALPVLAATVAFLATARSQWEAEAWVQIGQVGAAPVGIDPKVEPLLRVIERVKTVDFQTQVTQGLGMPADSAQAALYRRSLKTEPEPYANLFRLFVRGYSPDDAKALATATVTRLQAIHARLGAPGMEQAKQRMAELDDALRVAVADRERLRRSAGGGKDAALAGMLLAGRNDDVRALQKERADLAYRMTPGNTFATSMPLPVAVTRGRVYPNVPVVLGAGILAALFLGGLAATGRNALRRRSTKAVAGGTHHAYR
jgi:hypothetical protein